MPYAIHEGHGTKGGWWAVCRAEECKGHAYVISEPGLTYEEAVQWTNAHTERYHPSIARFRSPSSLLLPHS